MPPPRTRSAASPPSRPTSMPIPAPLPIGCGSRITSILRRKSYGFQSRRGLAGLARIGEGATQQDQGECQAPLCNGEAGQAFDAPSARREPGTRLLAVAQKTDAGGDDELAGLKPIRNEQVIVRAKAALMRRRDDKRCRAVGPQ